MALLSYGMAYRMVTPVEGVLTKVHLSVALGRKRHYRGGHPDKVVSYRRIMLPDFRE